jgi:flagellar biosynthetic protein FlhB
MNLRRPHTEATEITEKKNFSRKAAKPAKKPWVSKTAPSFAPLSLRVSCTSWSSLRASAPLRDLFSSDKRPHTEITEEKNFSRKAAKPAKKTWGSKTTPSFAASRLRVSPTSWSSLCASAPLRDLFSSDKRPHTEITEKTGNFSRRGAESAEREKMVRKVAESTTSSDSSLPLCFSVALCESHSDLRASVPRCESSFQSPWRTSGTTVFSWDLQRFAAEDEGRTEDPTEAKIRKAREEGKVVKSPDVTAAIILLLPLVTLAFLANSMWNTMVEMIHFYFAQATTTDPITGSGPLTTAFFTYLARLLAPLLAVALIAAVGANFLQVGALFTTKPIKPDFSRIVPKFGQWIKRSLFSTEALFNIGKQVVKVAIIAAVAIFNIQGEWSHLLNLLHVSFAMAAETLWRISLNIMLQCAVVMLILAIPDYLFQRHQHKESLKMSLQEVKEERKQQEGDPLIRSRLRERMREILRRNMMQNVPKADVVITNPTHFAIALQWDAATMTAPTVIAKGQDLIAQRIKAVAAEAGVPMVENRPLARALYAAVDIGDQVPQEYWELVSRILAEIYKLNGRAGANAARAVVS